MVDKDPVQEQDDKNLDDEFHRIEEEQKLREKQNSYYDADLAK